MKKRKVVRCSVSGACVDFAHTPGTVLGLKVFDGGLWLVSNTDQDSALIHYDLENGAMLRKFKVGGAGHNLNDLAITPSGDIFVTDTRAGLVWQLSAGAAELRAFPGEFHSANGIAVSGNGKLLYVSTFPDGITVVNPANGNTEAIGRPRDLSLAAIDGLCFYRGALIAIQNGFMNPRVIRLVLSADGRAIENAQVLERRNPLFDGITTGVIVNDDFFYMANIQDDKDGGFNPLTILKLHIGAFH